MSAVSGLLVLVLVLLLLDQKWEWVECLVEPRHREHVRSVSFGRRDTLPSTRPTALVRAHAARTAEPPPPPL